MADRRMTLAIPVRYESSLRYHNLPLHRAPIQQDHQDDGQEEGNDTVDDFVLLHSAEHDAFCSHSLGRCLVISFIRSLAELRSLHNLTPLSTTLVWLPDGSGPIFCGNLARLVRTCQSVGISERNDRGVVDVAELILDDNCPC